MNLVLFSSFYDSKNVRDFIQKKSKSANPKICYIPSFTSFHGLQATGIYHSLEKMGFSPDNISMFDVGYLFDKTKIDSLKNNDVIILGGGNTFCFNGFCEETELWVFFQSLLKKAESSLGKVLAVL